MAEPTTIKVPVLSEYDRSAGMAPSSMWKIIIQRFRRHDLAVFGFGIVFFTLLASLFAPWISPYYEPDMSRVVDDPNEQLLAPSAVHPFGTNHYGADMFSRLIWGARISILVGFISGVLSVGIGIVMGALAGYFGGTTDDIIMRIVDIMYAIPGFFLLVMVTTMFADFPGPPVLWIFLVFGLLGWAGIARIVRGSFLTLRERDFVEAARALGASDRRIIFKHIIPNALSPVIVIFTMGMGGTIMALAGLAFFGLGNLQDISWGKDLNDAQAYFRRAWWMSIFPGVAIVIVVIGFNLMGDGLRDALDPRLKE
ncbi:MAG: ABC transporter permease [Candidatus Kariarchaeaceae archaeon]